MEEKGYRQVGVMISTSSGSVPTKVDRGARARTTSSLEKILSILSLYVAKIERVIV